jgi:ABC-type transporter Mla subunit MlaD
MAEYRRAEITSGAFIVLSVLVFALFSFRVGGLNFDFLFGGGGVEFHAFFDDVKTLDEQAKVAVGGTQVGVVTKVAPEARTLDEADVRRLSDSGLDVKALGIAPGRMRQSVRVTFKITQGSLRLAEDASVKIEQEGFIGPFFLALNAGTWDAAAPPKTVDEAGPRATPLRAEAGAGLLDDFRTKFAPTLREIDGILSKVNQDLLGGSPEDLRRLVPLFAENLDEARSLLRRLDDLVDPARDDSVHATLLQPAKGLITKLDGAALKLDDLLKTALPEAEKLLKTANAAAADGERAIAALRRMAEEGDPKIQAILGDVQELTRTLASKKEAFAELLERGKAIAAELEKGSSTMTAMLKDNRANIAESLRTARNAMWELEVAMKKLRANPAVLIWGDGEEVLEAEPRDETGLRRSGRARPYEQRDERVDEERKKPLLGGSK